MEIRRENQELHTENKRLHEENDQLRRENRLLLNKISMLEKRISELENKKTSRNSHLPPSSDMTRKNQSLREKSGKKPGGQQGHKGATLQMSDTPDEIRKLSPDYCNECGADLSQMEVQYQDRRQVVELPPIKPLYIEYQRYSKLCSCGHRQITDYPSHVVNHIQYGPTVNATVGYLSTYQYVPFKRLCQLLYDCFGLSISEGSIGNMQQRLAIKATPVYELIKNVLTKSNQVGADETGIKVKGDKHWVWTWQNKLVTWMTVATSRGWKTVEALFPDGFANAVLNSDRWRSHLKTSARAHQLCMAHLLRDLNYLIEIEKSEWAKEMKKLFREAIKLKNRCGFYNKDDPAVVRIERKLDDLLAEPLSKEHKPKTAVFRREMNKYRHALFVFLYEADVPADNNASERTIRNLKVKQKVSGQFKTGADAFCILRSVIDSCIKRNVRVMQAFSLIAQMPIAPAV